MFYSKYDKRLLAEVINETKLTKKNKLLKKGKQVLILMEDNCFLTVCPISKNVTNKACTPEQVFNLRKFTPKVKNNHNFYD